MPLPLRLTPRSAHENVDNHPFPWKNNPLFFCRHPFLPYFCTPKNTVRRAAGLIP
jgi:hypothetical protein